MFPPLVLTSTLTNFLSSNLYKTLLKLIKLPTILGRMRILGSFLIISINPINSSSK